MAGPLTTPERIDTTILELHARVCKTMAHPVRLALLNAMRQGELSVGELAEATGVSQPTASQHLASLRGEGLVNHTRHGNEVHYSIAHPKMIEACDLLREVLFDRLRGQQALAGYLDETTRP